MSGNSCVLDCSLPPGSFSWLPSPASAQAGGTAGLGREESDARCQGIPKSLGSCISIALETRHLSFHTGRVTLSFSFGNNYFAKEPGNSMVIVYWQQKRDPELSPGFTSSSRLTRIGSAVSLTDSTQPPRFFRGSMAFCVSTRVGIHDHRPVCDARHTSSSRHVEYYDQDDETALYSAINGCRLSILRKACLHIL